MTLDEELAALVAAEKAESQARHPAGKKLEAWPGSRPDTPMADAAGYATGGLIERAALPRIEHPTGFVIPGPWLDRVHGGEVLLTEDMLAAPQRTGWARLRFEIADAWDVIRVGLVQPVIEWAAARVRRWTR